MTIGTKAEIRAKTMEERNRMTEIEVQKKSHQIVTLLEQQTFFQNAQNILFYYAHGKEVKTQELIEEYLDKKNLYLPKFISEEQFQPVLIRDLNLQKGPHGILEPVGEVLEGKLDVILIPGVAFDLKGQRLGRGKGHYDRFLAHQKGVLRVGLAYEFQIFDELPKESYDKGVDMIITDQKIIECY